MKKVITPAIFLLACLFAQKADAQEYKTALGIRLSNTAPMINNSITLKHFLGESAAIEALFSFGEPLSLGALYEIHKPLSTAGLQWYYGAGGYIGFVKSFNATKNRDETTTNFGGQGVLGLDYKFSNIPLNLSLDWKPELNLIDHINFEPAAIGFTARFVFK